MKKKFVTLKPIAPKAQYSRRIKGVEEMNKQEGDGK
jgi:hypothetical protein